MKVEEGRNEMINVEREGGTRKERGVSRWKSEGKRRVREKGEGKNVKAEKRGRGGEWKLKERGRGGEWKWKERGRGGECKWKEEGKVEEGEEGRH